MNAEELLYAIFGEPPVEIQNDEGIRMLQTTKYARKPFFVDAVQVTDDNIHDVANWCSGEVRTDGEKAKYIKVRVHRPAHDRQTKAFAGDYVLYAGTGFKVYTPKAFATSFLIAEDQNVPVSVGSPE